jgi:hypothetical protein
MMNVITIETTTIPKPRSRIRRVLIDDFEELFLSIDVTPDVRIPGSPIVQGLLDFILPPIRIKFKLFFADFISNFVLLLFTKIFSPLPKKSFCSIISPL